MSEHTELVIEVHDSGIGIPPEKFDLLFQRFSTLHDAGGTGLGLALCKKVANRMGGNVVLQKSLVNIGSVFRVQLPLRKVSLPYSCKIEFKQVFLKLGLSLDSTLPFVAHLIENKGEADFFDFICKSIGFDTFRFQTYQESHSWMKSLSGSNFIFVCDVKTLSEVMRYKDFQDVTMVLMPPNYLSYQQKSLSIYSSDLNEEAQSSSEALDLSLHSHSRIHPPLRRSELLEAILRCDQRHTSSHHLSDKYQKTANLKDLKILIVEDNRVNQKVLSRMLSSLNIESISVVENGLESVNFFKSNLQSASSIRVDVVLMDLQMPVMNGTDATKEIRNLFANLSLSKSMPAPFIVAVTASVSASQKNQIIEQGFDDCLLKPLSKSELEQCLRKFADRLHSI